MTNTSKTFTIGDKVVWDSGWGYEIGYFKGEGNRYYTYLIDIVTGIVTGECSHRKSEVLPYTDELITKLTAKYGYEKRFSDTF